MQTDWLSSFLPLLLLLGLAALTAYPMAMLFYGSLSSAPPGSMGTLSLNGYRQLFTRETGGILLNTALVSLAHTLISLPVASLLAWLVARTNIFASSIFEILLTLPFFLPPILTGMAWGMLGNPQVGSINLLWESATGTETPLINIYGWAGIIWHMCQYSIPFLILILVDAFKRLDPSLEEASRMSGASAWTTMWRITLAGLLPVLSSGFLLSFSRGLEAFESALIFGTPAKIEVATTAIYSSINQRTEADYQFATALSFAILSMTFILILLQWRLLRGRKYQTVTGKGFQLKVIKLGIWRMPATAVCIIVFAVMTLMPLAQLATGSFFRFFGFYTADMLTLDNWIIVLNDELFWTATLNTFLLGFMGASVTMILGTAVAYTVVRTRLPFRSIFAGLAWLPWLMPGMVLGVGFLWSFSSLPSSIHIYGTIWALLLAYVALGIPLATQVMKVSLAQISFDLDECARVHGANAWSTVYRILVALVYPSFMVGWSLTFFMILRELSASVLLYSPDTPILPVVVLRQWTGGKAEQCSVIALIMLLLVVLIRFVQLFAVRRTIPVS